MAPIIPALNDDCVAIILSFMNTPSLVNVARTSRHGKAVALPILVQNVTLRTYCPSVIVHFCNTVLRNHLARYIKRLNILHHELTEFHSALQAVVPGLIQVIACAENLAWLRICTSAEKLFHHAPALFDSLFIHPPSHSLELIGIADWDCLAKQQFAGLRNLSLGYIDRFAADPVNVLAIISASAPNLESMHLGGTLRVLPLRFTEGCIPCPTLRMLSIVWVMLFLPDLTEAFPNVQFIRCYSICMSINRPATTLSGSLTDTPPELLGLDGDLESVVSLGAHYKVRMIRIQSRIRILPQLAHLATALAWGSLCSLSLQMMLHVGEGPWDHSHIPAEHFFAEICRTAPRLEFFDLTADILPDVPDSPTSELHRAANRSHAYAAAWPHLARLDDLRCLRLEIRPYTPVSVNVAMHLLSNLPRVRFLVLVRPAAVDDICLERPEAITARADDVVDAIQLNLSSEELTRRLEWYQFESSDSRLEGVADWLSSVSSLGHV